MIQDAIGRAIDRCYDAVVDPRLWSEALHDLTRAVDAALCVIYPRDAPTALTRMPASRDYHDFLSAYVSERWYEGNYRVERGWPLLKAHGVAIEHDLASDEERRRLPHYTDLHLKWGLPGFAVISFVVGGRDWCVPFLRATEQGHFTPEDARHLLRLAPHFQRMISLSEKFASNHALSGLDILARMETAAFLVEGRGKVIRINACAEALLGQGIDVINGQLAATDRDSDRRLQALIAAALAADRTASYSAPPIAVARSGRRPLMVEAVPVRGRFADVLPETRALVLAVDLEAQPHTSEHRLQAVLGLTPAEAKVAAQLSLGNQVDLIADQFGVSRETVRNQIKAALAKTGTHRQAELVALVQKIGAAPPV